jgi:hypothetical protein
MEYFVGTPYIDYFQSFLKLDFPKSYRFGKLAHRIAQELYPSSTEGWYPSGIISVNNAETIRIDLKQSIGVDVAISKKAVKVKIGGSAYPDSFLFNNIKFQNRTLDRIYHCMYDVSNYSYMVENTKTSRIDLAYNLYGLESLKDVEIRKQERYKNLRKFPKARISIEQILQAVNRENNGVENLRIDFNENTEETMAYTIGKRGGTGIQLIIYLKQYDTPIQRRKAIDRHGTDNFTKAEYKIGAEVLKKQGCQSYNKIRERDILNLWRTCKKRFVPVVNDGEKFSEKFFNMVNTVENDIQRMEQLNITPSVITNQSALITMNGMINKLDEKGLAKVEAMLREARKTGYREDVIRKVRKF